MREGIREGVRLAAALVGPGVASTLLLLALVQGERAALRLPGALPQRRTHTMTTTRKTAFVAAGLVALLAIAGVALAHGGWRGGPSPGFTQDGTSVSGRFVAFDVDGATLSRLVLKDADATSPLLESVRLALPEGANVSGEATRRGYALDDGAGTVLRVEDSPRLGVKVRSEQGATLVLVLPEGAAVTAHEAVEGWSPAGASIGYGDGQKARLVLKNATLSVEGQTLTVTLGEGGAAHYHLAGPHPGPKAFGHGPMGMRGEPRGGPHRGHR